MKRWGILCALATGVLASLAFLPGPVAATGCGPGYEEGVNATYDADGDGLVCVNTETGAVTDDQGVDPLAADRNGDGIICRKPIPNGSVVTTDNNSAHEENSGCPPGFFPSPAS